MLIFIKKEREMVPEVKFKKKESYEKDSSRPTN